MIIPTKELVPLIKKHVLQSYMLDRKIVLQDEAIESVVIKEDYTYVNIKEPDEEEEKFRTGFDL